MPTPRQLTIDLPPGSIEQAPSYADWALDLMTLPTRVPAWSPRANARHRSDVRSAGKLESGPAAAGLEPTTLS
jgi:hypothetical protein